MSLSTLLILYTVLHTAVPAKKRWIGVSSWLDPDSWISGLPNGCDSALLESSQILNIAGQANIAELSFSGDGAIVFDSFSEISFSQSRYCADKIKNIKLFEADRKDFLSVDNWEYYTDFDNLDVLDIHRIPCVHDEIELPYREMRAELRSPVEVGAVSYGGAKLSKGQVVDWLNSQEGRTELRMLGTASFQMNDQTYCGSRSGCECGNEGSCNTTNCKIPLPCDDPLSTPVSCCPMCGTIFTLPLNKNKSYRQLELELSTVLSNQLNHQKLNIGIHQGELYLILKQRGDRSTDGIAALILDHLKYTGYIVNDNYRMEKSSFIPNTSEIHQTQHKTTSVLILTLACIVICLLLFGLILIVIIKLRTKQFYPIRNDFQPSACNTYETVDSNQCHIYETIHFRDSTKSNNLYTPKSSTRHHETPGMRDKTMVADTMVTDTMVTDTTVTDVLIQDIDSSVIQENDYSQTISGRYDKTSMSSV